ncbi:MAG: DUF4956 domain-containing protein [Candidatus Krumholzibacteriota bacterium]
MNKIQTFQEFLTSQSVQIPVLTFVFNLVIAAILAHLLSKIYVRYGTTLSNRKLFARNFVLMTMITMLIISIVKSSLALSLGLVGALSIVRFRAAIKEPEELMYLFFTIAIGLGLGADQTIITFIAFIVIVAIVIIHKRTTGPSDDNQNLHLTLTAAKSSTVDLDSLIGLLKDDCSAVVLKRFDESSEQLEASFTVEFEDYEGLSQLKNRLRQLDDSIRISFLDNKGLF